MNSRWQLQDAKNRLSEVVEQALHRGPQIITKRGVDTAVVLSYADFRELQTSQTKLSTFFRESPLSRGVIDLERDSSPLREDFAL